MVNPKEKYIFSRTPPPPSPSCQPLHFIHVHRTYYAHMDICTCIEDLQDGSFHKQQRGFAFTSPIFHETEEVMYIQSQFFVLIGLMLSYDTFKGGYYARIRVCCVTNNCDFAPLVPYVGIRVTIICRLCKSCPERVFFLYTIKKHLDLFIMKTSPSKRSYT